jgi:hypothetical protein
MSFNNLRELVYGVYGVWILYKKNCTSFGEITDFLEKMSCGQRSKFSADIQKIHTYNMRIPDYPVISMSTLMNASLEELSTFVPRRNLKWWEIDQLRPEGFSFEHLWLMTPDQRKDHIMQKYVKVYLAEVSKTTSYLDASLFAERRSLLKKYYYELFCVFISAGVPLRRVVELSLKDIEIWRQRLQTRTAELDFFEKVIRVIRNPIFKSLFSQK